MNGLTSTPVADFESNFASASTVPAPENGSRIGPGVWATARFTKPIGSPSVMKYHRWMG